MRIFLRACRYSAIIWMARGAARPAPRPRMAAQHPRRSLSRPSRPRQNRRQSRSRQRPLSRSQQRPPSRSRQRPPSRSRQRPLSRSRQRQRSRLPSRHPHSPQALPRLIRGRTVPDRMRPLAVPHRAVRVPAPTEPRAVRAVPGEHQALE